MSANSEEQIIAEAVVRWDGAGEDGCWYCDGEYIGDTEYIAHNKGCPIPVVRLRIIERLAGSNPEPDAPDGKLLRYLAAAQGAYELATAVAQKGGRGGT